MIAIKTMAKNKKQPYKIGAPPTELEFEKALMFFHAYMYGPLQGKLRLYAARNVHSQGAAMSSDWVVFASILVKDIGKRLAAGIDLSHTKLSLRLTGEVTNTNIIKTPEKRKLSRIWKPDTYSSITGIICEMLICDMRMAAR